MQLGIMADTHDRLPKIDAAVRVFQARGVEAVIHAGDFVAPFAVQRLQRWSGPLHVVYGNNDGERAGLRNLLPQIQDGPLFIEIGGRTILVHHFIDWCEASDIERAEVIVTGHTHEVVERREGDRLFLNPGECCGWVNGRCTVALLDTGSLAVEVVDLP